MRAEPTPLPTAPDLRPDLHPEGLRPGDLRPGDLHPGDLHYDERGLIPAVVQQHDTGEVLMVAWMSAEALAATLARGETVFWSRSRGELWHKGATSGNTQAVIEIVADCDADTLLVRVDQHGAGACHTGDRTCFRAPVVAGAAAGAEDAPPARGVDR